MKKIINKRNIIVGLIIVIFLMVFGGYEIFKNFLPSNGHCNFGQYCHIDPGESSIHFSISSLINYLLFGVLIGLLVLIILLICWKWKKIWQVFFRINKKVVLGIIGLLILVIGGYYIFKLVKGSVPISANCNFGFSDCVIFILGGSGLEEQYFINNFIYLLLAIIIILIVCIGLIWGAIRRINKKKKNNEK